jgi:hypothetical protein
MFRRRRACRAKEPICKEVVWLSGSRLQQKGRTVFAQIGFFVPQVSRLLKIVGKEISLSPARERERKRERE